MKILQVVNFFSPVHGGSAEVPFRLSRELAKRGHDITIYTSDYKFSHEWIESAKDLNIKVIPFRTLVNLANFQITPGLINSAKEIASFDLIHFHSYRTFQNIIVHHYAQKYAIPYVLQAHGTISMEMSKIRLKKMFDKVWGRNILRGAASFIAVTQMEIAQYKMMGVAENNIVIMGNGIDLSEFRNAPSMGEFRKKHSLDDKTRIILFLGRIHKIKRIDLLVRSFCEIKKSITDVVLVIIGPDAGYLGELKSQIHNLGIEEKVIITGPLYGKDKLEAYIDADVFVNPRPDEIFGIVFLEAAACGLPVICSKDSGLAEVVNGNIGIAISNDIFSISEAILSILNNDNYRQQLGARGRQFVQEQFGWDIIALNLERIYENCTHNKRTKP